MTFRPRALFVLLTGVAGCSGKVVLSGLPNDGGPAADAIGAQQPDGPPTADAQPTPLDGNVSTAAACATPGPFAYASYEETPTKLEGTWINCDGSIFENAGVPLDEIGVVFRTDGTWQKLGPSLVPLTSDTDHGTWSEYSGGIAPNILLDWNVTSLAIDPAFSPDGRTMQVTGVVTPPTILARVAVN